MTAAVRTTTVTVHRSVYRTDRHTLVILFVTTSMDVKFYGDGGLTFNCVEAASALSCVARCFFLYEKLTPPPPEIYHIVASTTSVPYSRMLPYCEKVSMKTLPAVTFMADLLHP